MNIEFAYIAHKYTDFDIHKNDKNPNVKVSDCIRISKYKNIFARGYT